MEHMPYGQLRARATQTFRKGMYGAVALGIALAPAGALAASGVGTPIVGGAAVIPPIQRPAPRPVVRPAPTVPRAPTVVTPRPKLPAPKPVVPADPTPIIQPAPFRSNTPIGAQPGSGAPLGVLPGGLATPLVGPAPAPNTCWFYTTPAKTVGYWSKCP
ncbi:hypothetical protein [Xanthobacter aminoxidans]|uniref:Uncharacterized protein n=1 Tax=Xanthobacter aminoxidans TaxID=186280 RepID=A0ABW6ZK79_9HYPH